ncbi:MAG: hypothetical protein ABSC53_06250 [Bacteroidota bacterium]
MMVAIGASNQNYRYFAFMKILFKINTFNLSSANSVLTLFDERSKWIFLLGIGT